LGYRKKKTHPGAARLGKSRNQNKKPWGPSKVKNQKRSRSEKTESPGEERESKTFGGGGDEFRNKSEEKLQKGVNHERGGLKSEIDRERRNEPWEWVGRETRRSWS